MKTRSAPSMSVANSSAANPLVRFIASRRQATASAVAGALLATPALAGCTTDSPADANETTTQPSSVAPQTPGAPATSSPQTSSPQTSSPQATRPSASPTQKQADVPGAGADGCWTTKVTETFVIEDGVEGSDTTTDRFCAPTATAVDANGMQSATFTIPKSPEHGVVSVALFYSGNTIKAANKTLRASGRGFSPQHEPAFDPSRDRATITLDFAKGQGTVTAAPTCEVLDGGALDCSIDGEFTSIPGGSDVLRSAFNKGNQVVFRNYDFARNEKDGLQTLTTYVAIRDPRSAEGKATVVAFHTDLYKNFKPCAYAFKTADVELEAFLRDPSKTGQEATSATTRILHEAGNGNTASTLSGSIHFDDSFYGNKNVRETEQSSTCPGFENSL